MPVDAQTAGEELERIAGKFGGDLQSKNIVDESRDENAVLHKCFEWDDTVAGELYRIHQADDIRRHIYCIVTKPAEDTETKSFVVRAWQDVSDDNQRQGKFIHINTALSDEQTRQRIVENALRELKAFQQKYQSYSELCGICKTIGDFIATFDNN